MELPMNIIQKLVLNVPLTYHERMDALMLIITAVKHPSELEDPTCYKEAAALVEKINKMDFPK